MARPERRKLERVQYWQGQMLKSRDFRDIQAVAAQRRWWHNRAMHNAYGVYKGLAISLTPDSSAVEVRPGVAYDCFGQELILQIKRTIPLPALPAEEDGVQFLLARYLASQDSCPDGSSGGCWGPQDRGLFETIEFFWKPRQSVTLTDGVPIGGALLKGKDFRLIPDLVRPSIQPLASALLVSGSTVPGNTAWDLWTAGASNPTAGANVIGVQTTIDTSAAGFTDIPIYFAQLEGPLWNPQTRQLVPALLPSIVDEAANSFTFQMWLPAPRFRTMIALPEGPPSGPSPSAAAAPAPTTQLVDAGTFSLFAQQQGLYVSWVGCQCLSACRLVKKPVAFVEQTLKP
jgi:hypothetical protein